MRDHVRMGISACISPSHPPQKGWVGGVFVAVNLVRDGLIERRCEFFVFTYFLPMGLS